ncbi:MAG: RNA polymerase factor sigma-54 [Prevotella sp.]|nr:RNA polymerase factor sigma-54 [Prevotella sp.]
MPQKLIQTQTQQQVQQQRLSQQQMLQVKLLEMPLAELEENILTELDDNPALEEKRDDFDTADNISGEENDGNRDGDEELYEEKSEREEREEALDNALESLGSDDELPAPDIHIGSAANPDADYEEIVWGDTTSFYDKLKEQMGMLELTEEQHDVMEYIIGSLDNDGLLRKDLDDIADELAIYHNIDVSAEYIHDVLRRLQTFDPAGIGARSLQECLLLQIERRPDGRLRDLMQEVITDHFEEFTKKHWDKISAALQLTDEQAAIVQQELRKLNPKPGAALGETLGRNTQQITPDFVVDTDEEGSVTFTINRGRIPELKVSPSFNEMVNTYKTHRHQMNRQEKEALLYAKEKVEKAQGYIEAVKQRRRTLYVTMKAIIQWQKKFFQDGDEADLRPMILKDIAEKTGLDISTISRVSNVKYAQTRWGTFPLRFFFTDSYVTKDGEEMSTRKIKLALKELIGQEEARKPLSDDALAAEMKRRGYPIARRTVAKYREQLGIPVARLRKG